MSQNANTDPVNNSKHVERCHFDVARTATAFGLFITVFAAIGQSVPDPIIKTILFCAASFCAVQVILLLFYFRVLGRVIEAPQALMLISAAPTTTPAPTAPISERRAIPAKAPEPTMAYEVFDLRVGEIWEKKIKRNKIRVELNDVLEEDRPNWYQKKEPCADVRIDCEGGVYASTLESKELDTNRFLLFRAVSTGYSAAIRFYVQNGYIDFECLIVDFVSFPAKKVTFIYGSTWGSKRLD